MPSIDDAENRETARQIELQQPGWMVLWGVYSREYVAFPLFPAPGGTILAAAYPPALVVRMREVERRTQHGRTRPHKVGQGQEIHNENERT